MLAIYLTRAGSMWQLYGLLRDSDKAFDCMPGQTSDKACNDISWKVAFFTNLSPLCFITKSNICDTKFRTAMY